MKSIRCRLDPANATRPAETPWLVPRGLPGLQRKRHRVSPNADPILVVCLDEISLLCRRVVHDGRVLSGMFDCISQRLFLIARRIDGWPRARRSGHARVSQYGLIANCKSSRICKLGKNCKEPFVVRSPSFRPRFCRRIDVRTNGRLDIFRSPKC
jgi:hypothetical protein